MKTNSRSSHPDQFAGWTIVFSALVALLVLIAHWLRSARFDRLERQDVAALFASSTSRGEEVVTEDRLRDLPAPVRRYLTYAGIVGKPVVRTVHLKQEGAIRASTQQPWIPLDAEQYYSVRPPGFVWDGAMRIGPLRIAQARDRYRDGHGNMLITLGSLVTIADARGVEMDQGALMRYLSEMIWFPAAFLGDNVSFTALDDKAARVTLTDHDRSVSGTLFVDEEGRLTNFMAERYRMVGNGYELDAWSTPVAAYGELAGLKLPVRGKAVWKLDEGDLEYIDVTITELEYDVTSPVPGASDRDVLIGGVT